MFTGLIEATGAIHSVGGGGGGKQIVIDVGRVWPDVCEGESLCVNGVCLTVSAIREGAATFDLSGETLSVTTADRWKTGEPVNLERAMAVGDRLGGHLVQGHVDGVGCVEEIERAEGETVMWIGADRSLIRQLIRKGSVAIDGVSLTVVNIESERFSVSLIPTTLSVTTLSETKVGDRVNLETDVIGKWINKRMDEVLLDKRLSETRGIESHPTKHSEEGLSQKMLREEGFV